MKRSDFHYDLPPESIAQEPVSPRDHSKLMVLKRSSSDIEHKHFFDLPQSLRRGDVLVLNDTKVIPARLRGRKASGGKTELLLISPQGSGWKALVRGTRRAAELHFAEGLRAYMRERLPEGEWIVEFSGNHLREYLDRHGEMPLPPYVKRPSARRQDAERYQTIYAKEEGAVAAPTAGFHFTPELLKTIQAQGIEVCSITLHVGWGTFRPVRTENIEAHRMLPESYWVSDAASAQLAEARRAGRRIIAVGTTVVRTLESIYETPGRFRSGGGQSSLFIYPGYRYQAIDALLTNFHLPDSTPLLLASAFYGGDRRSPFSLKEAYQAAVRHGYRFYSYGDAMFIQ